MVGVSGHQDCGPLVADRLSPSVVDVSGGVQADAGVTMLVVVPAEKSATVRASILEGPEGLREIRPVLHQGPEVALDVGAVITYVRAAVALGNSEVSQEMGDGLGDHGRTAICMDSELASFNTLG